VPNPLLYELNTRCWLRELSEKASERITLASVPEGEYARWKRLGFTHVWLMGVWSTGPRARAEALRHGGLRGAYDEALPGWTEADVGGSPYAIADYVVPPALGGEPGLEIFRERLHGQGLKLVLDFVPNHVGLDHGWVRERPELFVQSSGPTAETFSQETKAGLRWLAHGKDPYFPGWTDTVQLDYRRPETQAAMLGVLQSIATRCDGVRCDMAMLVLNDVFARTWERFADTVEPSSVPEFWTAAISTVKKAREGFLFLAEAYWGLEWRLQALGFDYTYDKTLYDRLVSRDAAGAQGHLLGSSAEAVAEGAHFLENHDEHRIASILSPAEHRAAALVILGLPGMRFLHDGQLGGARKKVPVQLLRRGTESKQPEIETMYEQLLRALQGTAVGQGGGRLLQPRAAGADNPTWQNFVLVQWQGQAPEFDLVAVNLAPHRSQCYAPLTAGGGSASNWALRDVLGEERYERRGDELERQGLYLDLPAHGTQLFHFRPT
jgi:hypothetical protein